MFEDNDGDGLDCFGVDELLKPLAKKAGQYGRVYGDGIKDGRGYGPYGAGYTRKEPSLPYGPNGEPLSAAYDYQGSALNWKPPKKVLPGFSSTSIGFEMMDLAKAGTGMLSGFGGMFGGGGGGGTGAQTQNAQQAAADRQRLEDEKRRAEQSANNMKIALGVGGALAAVGITIFAMRK